MPKNIFSLPDPLPNQEIFEPLFPDNGTLVERIISTGQTTSPGEWYAQDRDEWVALLQGKAVLVYENGHTLHLNPGDHILIPAHTKHRVEYTSKNPPCIWLAIHGNLIPDKQQT